jgi:putative hydrolase of the HAD superfamily
MPIAIVGVDGDDTLWFHERLFIDAQEKLSKVIHEYISDREWSPLVGDILIANINVYGYGIKSFSLSVLEAAIIASKNRITASELMEIIKVSKEMLAQNVDVVAGVDAALQLLCQRYRVLLITKGDMSEQRSKLQSSKLIGNFASVEVVREKNLDTYNMILKAHGEQADRFVMIGNSVRSDINPVLELGGWAIHVPSQLIWQHEVAEPVVRTGRYFAARDFEAVPRIVENIHSKLSPRGGETD